MPKCTVFILQMAIILHSFSHSWISCKLCCNTEDAIFEFLLTATVAVSAANAATVVSRMYKEYIELDQDTCFGYTRFYYFVDVCTFSFYSYKEISIWKAGFQDFKKIILQTIFEFMKKTWRMPDLIKSLADVRKTVHLREVFYWFVCELSFSL